MTFHCVLGCLTTALPHEEFPLKKIVKLTGSLMTVTALFAVQPGGLAAEIHRDNFNRANMSLRSSARWDVAHGAFYGYQTDDNRLVSVYAPLVGPGGISADKYVGAVQRSEKYHRISIDIRFPQTAGEGHAPQFHLVLNWQGKDLFASGYRLALRGTQDFSVFRSDEKGTETITSGWQTYLQEPLKTNEWYRLTLEKNERTISGSIETLAGKVVGKTKIVDLDQETWQGGHPVLLSRYLVAPVRSIELDNFEYELSDRQAIQAAAVDVKEKVEIDGRLIEPYWRRAEVADGFCHAYQANNGVREKVTLQDSPTARIAFDHEHLYVGIQCPLPNRETAERVRALQPSQMFVGNTVEVFLDPLGEYRRRAGLGEDLDEFFFNHLGPKVFRFAVNAANGRHSELMGIPWWKVPWQSATSIHDDFWSAELAIPYASLAYFEQGDRSELEPAWNSRWGVNFAVDGQVWIAPLSNNLYPVSVGEVTGITTDPQRHRWALLTGIGPRLVGDVPLVFTVSNATAEDRRVKVTAHLLAEDTPVELSTLVIEKAVKKKSWSHGSLSLPISSPGTHVVQMTIEEVATGNRLVHRPILIDDIQVGVGRWDRSFYMHEHEARLFLTLGKAVSGKRSLRCELRAAGQTELRQTRTVTRDGKSECCAVFDLDSLPHGQYRVRVVVDGYEQAPFNTEFRKLAPQEGAVQYTERGVLLRDGKPFFPFGMYYVEGHLKGAFLEEYAVAGFNTFLMEWGSANSFVTQIQRVKKLGLVPIVGLHNTMELRSATANETIYSKDNLIRKRLPATRETVRMMSRQVGSNLLAWYTRDEPNELMYDLVRGMHEVVHQEDPYHPTMTVIFTQHLFPAYHDATDILGPDIYPSFPGGRIAAVGDAMRKAVGEMGGKPVIAVLQSFFPQGDYRMPNRTELRCMAYLSVVSGATGIMWFSYDYNGVMSEKHPQAWAAIKELAGEFKQLGPAFLADRSNLPRVQGESKVNGPVPTVVYRHDGSLFVVAVNDKNQELGSVQFSVEKNRPVEVEVLFEQHAVVPDRSGSWTDHFGPYDVRIYRVNEPRE